jgi:hypothetical protein
MAVINVIRKMAIRNVSHQGFSFCLICVIWMPKHFFIVILKGFKKSLTQDFHLQVFFMIQFTLGPEYPSKEASTFVENLRRYLRMNVY